MLTEPATSQRSTVRVLSVAKYACMLPRRAARDTGRQDSKSPSIHRWETKVDLAVTRVSLRQECNAWFYSIECNIESECSRWFFNYTVSFQWSGDSSKNLINYFFIAINKYSRWNTLKPKKQHISHFVSKFSTVDHFVRLHLCWKTCDTFHIGYVDQNQLHKPSSITLG